MLMALAPFLCGILIANRIPICLCLTCFVSILFALTAALCISKKPVCAQWFILIALLLCGHAQVTLSNLFVPKNHLICALPREDVAVIGRVDSMPISRDDFSSFILDVRGIEVGYGELRAASGRVRMGVSEPLTAADSRFRHGAVVRVEAILEEPGGYENPGVFNTRDYLAREGIFITGDVGYWDFVAVLDDPHWYDCMAWISMLRVKLIGWLEASANPFFEDSLNTMGIRTDHVPAFSQALILGHRTNLDDRTRSDFQSTGMYHVLAISGLHIAIIASCIRLITRMFLRNYKLRSGVTIVVLILYSVLAGFSSSVVRSSVMVVFASLAVILDRPVRTWNIVAAAALGLLTCNPRVVWDIGFQLTFTATIGILSFSKPIHEILRFIPVRFLRETISMSIAAQFSTALISAIHFNSIGILAFLPYILTMPLIICAIWSGFAGLLLFWCPLLGEICLRVHALTIAVFSFVVQLLADLPMATINVLTPEWPEYICWGSLVIALLTWQKHRKRCFIAITAACVMVCMRYLPQMQTLAVHFLDVGNGDSIIIQMPDGEGLLIDAGGIANSKVDIGCRIVSRMLRNLRIRRLAVLAATHEHPDHIGGMPAIIEAHRINSFWISSRSFSGPAMKSLIQQADKKQVKIEELETGSLWTRLPINENDRSLIFALEYGSCRMLFAADAESASESGLLDYGLTLRSTVLKLGHHGSRTSSSLEFLREVDPSIVIIPCGYKNQFGHPHPEVLERLDQALNIERIYRSDLNGMITVYTDGRDVEVCSFR